MATYLNKTLGTATNTKKFTIAVWCKRGDLSSNNYILAAGTNNNDYIDDLRILSNGQLVFDGYVNGATYRLKTEKQLRDPSAWYHIVVRYDSTQSTSSERLKMYINGEGQTVFETATYPSLNYDPQFNKNVEHMVGRNLGGSNYWQGYLSQLIFIDGTAYDPSPFGSTNSNGVWIPNSTPSVTYGNNGFKLDFKLSGTSADASGFGADSSGQNNHFASNSLGTNPNVKDSPTNIFATFNPLDNDTITGAATLSNGNTVINANSDAQSGCPSTMAVSEGKWYIEGKCLSGTFEMGMFGYGDGFPFNLANHPPYGDNGYPFAYEYSGKLKINNSDSQTGLASFTTNDILAIALDMDNNTIKFFKNGSQVGSTITDSNLSTFAPYSFYVANHTGSNTNMFSLNTGNPTFTIASGNADANGYGNFEYAVPSGYYALCTKNLATYG